MIDVKRCNDCRRIMNRKGDLCTVCRLAKWYSEGKFVQKKLAEDLGVGASTVSNWVRNRKRPSGRNRVKLTKAMNDIKNGKYASNDNKES